ncbi:MAG TPA: citrate/2-methylcitrate synthase [Actinomycetota bacterium]
MSEKGLREVVAAETQISDIDGEHGRLWYVGYPIEDLAANATFEETIYLLHNLDLPTRGQLDELVRFLRSEREMSPFLAKTMRTLSQNTSPMSMLRTATSASSAFDPDGWDERAEAQYRKALRLIAETPTLIATYHRMRTGQELVPPHPTFSQAANFLWMLHGEEPDPEDAAVLDTTFVLYADHTMNASTFTARIVASTLSDMFSAITAAIGSLKGPLHGGANEGAMKLAEIVGKPENAEAVVRERLERKEKIMGFGHAVYRTMDPRAAILKELCREVGERHGDPIWYEIFDALERTTLDQKGLYPNVDLYAAGVYHVLGIPTDLMTPVFAAARMAGWTAHVREQYANNRIIRPGSEYVGPRDRRYVPIGERG